MELIVAGVGKRMPGWVAQGWSEYACRMPAQLPLRLVEVAAAQDPGRTKIIEATRLAARLPERARRVAMNAQARPWSTDQLARHLADWQEIGDPVVLLIGGAEGLDESLLESCQQCWSLGPAVFPHMLVRVLVAEQIYRAWTILAGHPYHRGH